MLIGPARLLGAMVATSLALGACSGGGDPEAQESAPSSASTSASASLSEEPSESVTVPSPTTVDPNEAYGLKLPKGTKLTREGMQFVYGRAARVGFLVKKKVGIATLTVKGVRKGSMEKDFADFVIDEETAKATPYYVDVDLENVGETDLGDLVVPLMLTDGNGTLVEQSTFAASFEPCAASPLPAEFPPGKKISTCLAYVVSPPGEIRGVTFRPSPTFDPINWGPKKAGKPKKPKKSKPTATGSQSPSTSESPS